MNITVRLYRLHDYDLIYLYKNLQYPVKDLMKRALIAYVRNEPEFFDFPVKVPPEDELLNVKNAQFHLVLHEFEDADIIDFLLHIKPYYRNNFLKNLVRYYISGPPAFVYMKDPDVEDTKFKISTVRENITGTKEIPLMKKRKRKKKVDPCVSW